MTVFDAAIDSLFADPNLSVAATWRVGGIGDGVAVRIIRVSPADLALTVGGVETVSSTALFAVRAADIAAPAPGDTVTLATGEVMTVQGAPSFDQRKQVWTCDGGGA